MDELVVAVWEAMLPDGDPLEVAKAAEAMIGFFQARQLVAFHEVYQESEAGADPDGVVVDPCPPEVACAMLWSPGVASAMVDVAVDVVTELPAVLQALSEGRIDLGKVREIVRATGGLEVSDRQEVADRAISYAASHTKSQLRPWLTRQVDRIDPDAAERRRKRARKQRGVWLTPEPDGMATLSAYLSAEEASACMASVRAGCRSADGSRDANQADTFVELLTGIRPAQQVPVTVIMTDQGAEIEGYGPISDGHAADLLARLELPSVTVLTRPPLGIRYAPSLAMRRYVQVRDRHCRFPGCRRPARACDLDHLVAWPQGPTDEANLACLCRTHHRLKTHTGWTVRRLPGGILEWTSPTGRVYRSTLEDP